MGNARKKEKIMRVSQPPQGIGVFQTEYGGKGKEKHKSCSGFNALKKMGHGK